MDYELLTTSCIGNGSVYQFVMAADAKKTLNVIMTLTRCNNDTYYYNSDTLQMQTFIRCNDDTYHSD